MDGLAVILVVLSSIYLNPPSILLNPLKYTSSSFKIHRNPSKSLPFRRQFKVIVPSIFGFAVRLSGVHNDRLLLGSYGLSHSRLISSHAISKKSKIRKRRFIAITNGSFANILLGSKFAYGGYLLDPN